MIEHHQKADPVPEPIVTRSKAIVKAGLRSPLLLWPLLFSGIYSASVCAEPASLLSQLAAPCLACHSLSANDNSRVGPTLAGIAGRELGAEQDYLYSKAFTNKALQGAVWDRDSLDSFLQQPQAFVEGTSMRYPGVADNKNRRVLLDWLLSDPSASVAELEQANFLRNPAVHAILQISADVAYGEYLAGECLTCHQPGSNSGSVPPIHNLTRDYFVHALLEYKNGDRNNSVMQTIASALGEEEIAALSVVFARFD